MNFILGMDAEKWNTYYKFCFVRNPYDRAVSGYHYITSMNDMDKLKEFEKKCQENGRKVKIFKIPFHKYYLNYKEIEEFAYIHTRLNQTMNIIDENKNIFIDFIGKFENIEEDFIKILKKIGFEDNEIVHDTGKVNSTSHDNYKSYYINNDVLKEINMLYEDDFKNFEYKKIEDISQFEE